MGCSIAVNSSSSTSISVTGGASINTSGISTVGGYTMNNGGSMSPLPQTGKVAQADPLGSLPSPTVPSSCNYTNYVATGPVSYTHLDVYKRQSLLGVSAR